MKIFLFLLLLAAAAPARADVLFLDMNMSNHEIEAAEAAAKKSGRRFAAYPPMTRAERKEIYELHSAVEANAANSRKFCEGVKVGEKKPACEAIRKKVQDSRERREAIKKKYAFTPDSLREFLKDQKAKGANFSSVVVSGHNGTGSLHGELGDIEDSQLATILDETGFKDSVRSLHLWGCYTVSPGSVMMNWKPRFPNVGFISGYDDRAPLSDKPAGWKYLAGVIEREPSLHQITDAKKLQEALKKIPGALDVHAAISNCNLYANHKESYDIEEYGQKCGQYGAELEKRVQQYECFLQANQPGCENPPADTAAGPLREYYGILQKTEPCIELTPAPIFAMHSRDQALRLLFGKNVLANLGNAHAKDLSETDELLKAAGAPDTLTVSNLPTMNRMDALKRLDEVLAFIRTKSPGLAASLADFKIDQKSAELAALLRTQEGLTQVIAKLQPNCVPYAWHDGVSSERSSCLNQIEVGKAGADKLAKKSDLLRATLMKHELAEIRSHLRDADKSVYEKMLMQAKLDLGYASTDEMTDAQEKRRRETNLTWATLVERLNREGVADPANHPEARRLQYESLAATSEQDAKSGEGPPENAALNLAIAEAARAKIALVNPSITGAEKEKLEAKFSELQASTSDQLYRSELALLEQKISGIRQGLGRLRDRRAGANEIARAETALSFTERKKAKLEAKPELATKVLWEKKFEKLPIDLEEFIEKEEAKEP